jgi:thioredoxin-dependent peroxiredoxin
MAPPQVGDPAPDFDRPWTGEGDSFRLSDQRGEWVILAFYPGDFTAVCTKQFCDYRDGREQVDALDALVVGISPQDVASHERFTTEHGLTVPLVADEDLEVAAAYGVKAAGFVRRAVFIVDPGGTIRHRDVKLLGLGYADSDELARALADARGAAAGA